LKEKARTNSDFLSGFLLFFSFVLENSDPISKVEMGKVVEGEKRKE